MLLEKADECLQISKSIQELAIKQKRTVSSAESCTGGLLASLFTHHPGSSRFYLGGVSSYSNEAKINLLGVDRKCIEEFGAVSEQTATAMAEGALAKFNADYAISITGVAGPGGGSPEKPVGMICCGLALRGQQTKCWTKYFQQDRLGNRSQIVAWSLQRLLEEIEKDT